EVHAILITRRKEHPFLNVRDDSAGGIATAFQCNPVALLHAFLIGPPGSLLWIWTAYVQMSRHYLSISRFHDQRAVAVHVVLRNARQSFIGLIPGRRSLSLLHLEQLVDLLQSAQLLFPVAA